MKRLFLLGLICVTLIGGFQKTYSMSSKKMKETNEGKQITAAQPQKTEIAKENTRKLEKHGIEPLEQLNVIINKQNIIGLYNELSKKGDKREVRSYPSGYSGDYYEAYTGEKLLIKMNQPVKARIIEFPYMSENEIAIEGDIIHFETYYQGEYKIEVEGKLGKKRVVAVKVKHKYNFTEEQNYDIILNSYSNKDYDVFTASKELFILSYPNSFKIKEILFMDTQLNIELKNYDKAKKSIIDIKNLYKLTVGEKEKLILLEEKTFERESKAHRNFLYENKEIESIRVELLKTFDSGDRLDARDLEFLREEYEKNPTPEVASLIGDHYLFKASKGEAIKYLTYAKEYEKIAEIYLDERDFDLFNETLEMVPSNKRASLLNKKKKVLETKEVEKEIALGRDRFESENYQEAILFFDRAQRRNSGIAKELGVELDLGLSYYNLFDYNKAIEHLKQVKRTGNLYKALEADYYTAMSYYRGEDQEKSLEYFDKIVRDYPETSWAKKSMIYIIRLRKE